MHLLAAMFLLPAPAPVTTATRPLNRRSCFIVINNPYMLTLACETTITNMITNLLKAAWLCAIISQNHFFAATSTVWI